MKLVGSISRGMGGFGIDQVSGEFGELSGTITDELFLAQAWYQVQLQAASDWLPVRCGFPGIDLFWTFPVLGNRKLGLTASVPPVMESTWLWPTQSTQ